MIRRLAKLMPCLIINAGLLLTACSEPPDTLEQVKERGVLRVLTRNGATTYYENQGRPTGFEYHLAKGFANQLGVELEIIPLVNLNDIFDAIKAGKGDIAAAGLTKTPAREQFLDFGPPYLDVKQLFVYNRAFSEPIGSINDLIGRRIRVIGNSAHAELLNQLKIDHPELRWEESQDQEPVDLFEMLSSGEIDLTIADSSDFYTNRPFYPDFRIALLGGDTVQVAWAMAKGAQSASLLNEIQAYFDKIETNHRLSSLKDQFFNLDEDIRFINTHTFMELKNKRLPKYRQLIEQVAVEYDIDWRLLAAISYQESHWNPKAKSPTGVRGFMMLTLPTAEELDVDDRLDTLQSLRGGARYYLQLYNRLSKSIPPSEKKWFALAAYNMGIGHLRDARKLTEMNGGDPSLWRDVKENLPLLRQRKWHKQLKFGFARGDEAVIYVENIRKYYSLLTWDELNQYRTPPPRRVADHLPASLIESIHGL
ncbi:membrane-bound lytic murein transglycosylase MltF [Spongiibacter sp. KMU-158]|uniref:Membrane-bound lytic murein transglycosylase F n=1 Tax=Spongiibacter pelagi TaxID=2760804 RepID=A0A927GXF5_9GAMM|nr:membrane-bound lytic murein transglycosylase MltF [Spongiibacter pelagi]MBD2859952.1 membrane-bound lytic murein transglycosylase MltF [Spongiibacter pelagi]